MTPPTDRPLTAGDVPLLREGDVLRVTRADSYLREEGFADGSLVHFRSGDGRFIDIADLPYRQRTSPDRFTFVARPATSAATEGKGDKLPDGAISGTDDGQTVWLESSTGGAHKLGVWGGLSLRFEEADGTHTIRDYVDAALRNRTSEPEAGAVARRIMWDEGQDWDFSDTSDDPLTPADESRIRKQAFAFDSLYTHPAPAPAPAPATADKLKVANEALEFFKWARNFFWCEEGSEIDGGDFQEAAERIGLIVKVPFDPDRHTDSGYGLEAGDDWFETAPHIAQALAALNEQPQ